MSWNEFVSHMLAKGEVEQIVVKPDIEKVVVYLHEGAIINGKPVARRHYQMTIPGVQNFETKLRKAEVSLGIRPEHGVPVIYSRNDGELASLITLVIIALIVMRLLGGKGKGGGLQMKFGDNMMVLRDQNLHHNSLNVSLFLFLYPGAESVYESEIHATRSALGDERDAGRQIRRHRRSEGGEN